MAYARMAGKALFDLQVTNIVIDERNYLNLLNKTNLLNLICFTFQIIRLNK